jgi:hypothetical protein
MEFTYKGHAIIEVLGKPKEHVEQALKNVVASLKESNVFNAHDTQISDVINAKDTETMFTGFVESEVDFKVYDDIFGFVIDFMPSSLEIYEPEDLKLDHASFNNMLNDIIARIHEYDKIVRDKIAETVMLERKLDLMIRNTIMVLLSQKKMNSNELSKSAGIDPNGIRGWLNQMVTDGILKTDGSEYWLSENAHEMASGKDITGQ